MWHSDLNLGILSSKTRKQLMSSISLCDKGVQTKTPRKQLQIRNNSINKIGEAIYSRLMIANVGYAREVYLNQIGSSQHRMIMARFQSRSKQKQLQSFTQSIWDHHLFFASGNLHSPHSLAIDVPSFVCCGDPHIPPYPPSPDSACFVCYCGGQAISPYPPTPDIACFVFFSWWFRHSTISTIT